MGSELVAGDLDNFPEPIRLLVWDLDDTFWSGTLSEGGIKFLQRHKDLVIDLAHRGIMSSICSKNDFDKVKEVLTREGVWDYFIFPSINWEPKGPRLAQLIEVVQLRPESVMFIDDNHGNRSEARFFVPDIQVADVPIIPFIKEHPHFKGKDDQNLARLKQYKLLEARKADEIAAGSDNVAFLRSSDIRVTIDHNIEAHLDRAVELINRTNQLNFTKKRLPEDPIKAAADLRRLVAANDINAGIIRVRDNYGDYGFCGLFVTQIFAGGAAKLLHFCFSCRILNMGVEAYVYQLLNRPVLSIEGPVLSDPIRSPVVDWIKIAQESSDDVEGRILGPSFSLHGGCDLAAIEHYARLHSPDVIGEYNIVRDGVELRLDHSITTRYAIQGIPSGAKEAIFRLGYAPQDFESRLFSQPRGGVWALSFTPDQWVSVYKHKATGTLIPFFAVANDGLRNLCEVPKENYRNITSNAKTLAALEVIAKEFEYVGGTPESVYKENLRSILRHISHNAEAIFLVLNKEYYGDVDTAEKRALPAIERNKWQREVAVDFPNVTPILITSMVRNSSEIHGTHFDRMVYLRLFNRMLGQK